MKAGFVDASAVFINATHIKAGANNRKYINELVKIEAQALLEKINKDRAALIPLPPCISVIL